MKHWCAGTVLWTACAACMVCAGVVWGEDPFHAPPEAAEPSPAPEPRPPAYRVRGVVATPKRQAAALYVGEDQLRVFTAGDRLPDGSVVRSIGLGRVILRRQGRNVSLEVPR